MTARNTSWNTFETHDGQALGYRHWEPISQRQEGAIVLLHRGHEHSGRVSHLVEELDLPAHAFFAWDARGHGDSPGARGHSPSVGTSVRDVDSFVRHIGQHHGIPPEKILVVGQSVGAVLAAAWVHDYAPNIRGMVLAAPAFDVRLYVPLARPALRLLHALRGDFFVNSYVKARFLTHDRDRRTSYDSDPKIARAISVNMLLGLHDLSKRLIDDAAAITVPTQLLISGSDWVVNQQPQHRFFERLGSRIKQRHTFDGFYHDTLGERDREIALAKIREFVLDRFSRPIEVVCLRQSDKLGFTRREADRLGSPKPLNTASGLYWWAAKLGIKTGGNLSRGMRLGAKAGFDSGAMLDYVYENEPRGLTRLGRAVDRNYLNSPGWTGIRQRKENIEELLTRAVALTESDRKPTHIVDVAAGHGRTVLDAVAKTDVRPDTILLRDLCPKNVEAGRSLIEQRELADTATFVAGDAFDPTSIADIMTPPTIVLVAGLYELFSDNERIATSLSAIAAQMGEGGYLIYTGQPWHPQLELIARTLVSHREGRPWIMRRRTQGELDQLVADAGFDKLEQRIDEAGIFSVALAKKRQLRELAA